MEEKKCRYEGDQPKTRQGARGEDGRHRVGSGALSTSPRRARGIGPFDVSWPVVEGQQDAVNSFAAADLLHFPVLPFYCVPDGSYLSLYASVYLTVLFS